MKKILFLTGTRADFGKIKSLIRAVAACDQFEFSIFATGMHTLSRYGFTVDEILKAGFKNIHTFMNQIYGEPMELVLANTISGLSRYVHEYKPDLIVIHGDRVEALAAAIVGALNNILIAHIEGGEISGTVDELIRHAVSKLSHIHFVANFTAANRLIQLGEEPKSIYIIGSPDIDIMLSPDLPTLEVVKDYYEISFEDYSIVLFHSVTTEIDKIKEWSNELVNALIDSNMNYIVIYPNNDVGCEDIFAAYSRLHGNPRFRFYASMRFEYFLTLLKSAKFIIGNSSVGVMEAPVYAVPAINIGNRQKNRFRYESIINTSHSKKDILKAIFSAKNLRNITPCNGFGEGNSAQLFMDVIMQEGFWFTPKQKQFIDINFQDLVGDKK